MSYKFKSLFTLTCLSVALLGTSFGVTKSVNANIIEIGYENTNNNKQEVFEDPDYDKGFRDGSQLFAFNGTSKFSDTNPRYKVGYEEGNRRTRENYPILSLIGDAWNWAESWFK